MKKLLFFLIPLTCFAQVRNVQVNGSGNLITPSTGINFTSGQTLLASSGATLNFSAATVTLPATTAIPPPASPTTGDLLVYSSGVWAKLSPGTSGFALISNGAAALPTYQAVSGSGTVTSVAATVPSFLSVAGSPITTTGTLTVTLATESANLVFAGPSSGSAAAPTFRSMVAADIPPTAVSAGSYGDATHVGTFTVDAAGRITTASNASITAGLTNPMTTAGDLIAGGSSGTPSRLAGGATNGYVLTYDSTKTLKMDWEPASGGSGTVSSGTGNQFAYYASSGSTVSGTSNLNYFVDSNGSNYSLFNSSDSVQIALKKSSNAKGAIIRFQYYDTSDEWFVGVPYNGASPTGRELIFQTYIGGSAVSRFILNTSGALSLPAYGAGAIVSDSSGNLSSNTGYVNSAIASGSAVSLTTATATNVTSISVPAGTWFISGNINFSAASATVTGTSGGISSTSATPPTDGTEVFSGVQVTLLSETDSVTLPRKRFVLGSTTTVYLIGKSTFSAGTVSAFGSITAQQAY